MVRVKENRKVIPVTTVGALLTAYDEHMRGLQPTPPAGVRYERDGPLLRAAGGHRGYICGPRDVGVTGAELDRLIARIATAPDGIAVVAAEAGGDVVCAAWMTYFEPGAGSFARLLGGSTLPQWRGRGIYRALVAARAQRAAARGVKYLQVDASDDSAPILRRLGFRAVTTTTTYVWTPPQPATPG